MPENLAVNFGDQPSEENINSQDENNYMKYAQMAKSALEQGDIESAKMHIDNILNNEENNDSEEVPPSMASTGSLKEDLMKLTSR